VRKRKKKRCQKAGTVRKCVKEERKQAVNKTKMLKGRNGEEVRYGRTRASGEQDLNVLEVVVVAEPG
jgi:hypothetical protein